MKSDLTHYTLKNLHMKNDSGGSLPSPQFNFHGDVDVDYETTDLRALGAPARFESQDLKLEHQQSNATNNPFQVSARCDSKIPQTPHINSNLNRSGSDYASVQQQMSRTADELKFAAEDLKLDQLKKRVSNQSATTKINSEMKSSPENVESGSPPQNSSLQAEGGQQESCSLTLNYNSGQTTAYESAQKQDEFDFNDRVEDSEESSVESEDFSEVVYSCNSFGKSSIVYNEEDKVIFNRWQKLFQFRNIKETAKKSKRNKRKRGEDDSCVAMGQYFFPFTMQLPTQGPNGEELPSSFLLSTDRNSKNEKKYGIKWTISFSFDQHFSANSVLSHTKEINLIFDSKQPTIDVNSLLPQKKLLHAYERLTPPQTDVDIFAHD